MVERLDYDGVDLVLELGERNTARRCSDSDCDTESDYYVLCWDSVSEYVCTAHTRGAIERAREEPMEASA